jgi:hypothetical protein
MWALRLGSWVLDECCRCSNFWIVVALELITSGCLRMVTFGIEVASEMCWPRSRYGCWNEVASGERQPVQSMLRYLESRY